VTNPRLTGTNWESWVDTVIRQGQERGEFDNLPGTGRPIDGLDKPHDELWWVRKKLKDEEVSYLPPTLALRKDKEDTLEAVMALRSEARARQLLEELNERIRAVNRRTAPGPPSTVMPLDIEHELATWRRHRSLQGEQSNPAANSPVTKRPPKLFSWRKRLAQKAR
jgi:hypothetical protein